MDNYSLTLDETKDFTATFKKLIDCKNIGSDCNIMNKI